MKREIKTKWLQALRGGKYGQTRGQLRREDRFCCLGVLADVARPFGGEWDGDGYYCYDAGDENPSPAREATLGHLIKGELDWLEPEDGQEGELIKLNDEGADFLDIADWIEKNVEVDDAPSSSNALTNAEVTQ